MKKSTIVFVLSLILGISLFVGMILKTGLGEIWMTLKNFSIFYFFIFIVLSTLNFGLYSLRWALILRRLLPHDHKQVPFVTLFLHRMAGFALSYITPSAQTGGEPLRIVMLHHDGIPAGTATSSVIIDKGLEWASLLLFIAIGIGLAAFDGSLPPGMKTFFWFLLPLFVFIIFWFYYSSIKNIGFFSSLLKTLRLHKFRKVEKSLEKIVEIEEQMADFYKKNGRLFLFLTFISIVITAFLLLEHYMVAYFLGVHMSLFQTFIVSTIPYLAFMLPIPGGLGLLESSHAAMFALLGIHINAFVLVFIIRIRDLVFVFVGLIHASKQGLRMVKKAFAGAAGVENGAGKTASAGATEKESGKEKGSERG